MRSESVNEGGGWLLGLVFGVVFCVFALGAMSAVVAAPADASLTTYGAAPDRSWREPAGPQPAGDVFPPGP